MQEYVYRCENPEGGGPYAGRHEDWQEEPHNDTSGRPGPWEDFGFNYWEKINKGYPAGAVRFGCPSIESLLQWFSISERQKLNGLGFRFYKYKAEVICKSENQCAFLYNTAELIDQISVI